jgi:anti-sigma regulatory factor (Ser/Thr protein kinase)
VARGPRRTVSRIDWAQEFPPHEASVPEARQRVAAFLATSSYLGDTDTVLLLVSELVTNAVRHARTSFELSIAVRGPDITVSVVDHDQVHQPRLRHPAALDTSGRGLHLVQELATSWGTELVARDAKRVWFRC